MVIKKFLLHQALLFDQKGFSERLSFFETMKRRSNEFEIKTRDEFEDDQTFLDDLLINDP